MGTLRESALEYERKTTKVVSDLKTVKAELDLQLYEGEKKNGEKFSYQFIEVEGERYRVPEPVLEQMKVILTDNPEVMEFKVKKTGEGKEKTVYTVIPV